MSLLRLIVLIKDNLSLMKEILMIFSLRSMLSKYFFFVNSVLLFLNWFKRYLFLKQLISLFLLVLFHQLVCLLISSFFLFHCLSFNHSTYCDSFAMVLLQLNKAAIILFLFFLISGRRPWRVKSYAFEPSTVQTRKTITLINLFVLFSWPLSLTGLLCLLLSILDFSSFTRDGPSLFF